MKIDVFVIFSFVFLLLLFHFVTYVLSLSLYPCGMHIIHCLQNPKWLPFSLALEIWDALRAAAEADLTLAQAIVDSAGVIVQSADLTICYDERGTRIIVFLLSFCSIFYFQFCLLVLLTSNIWDASIILLQVQNMNYRSMLWANQQTWFEKAENIKDITWLNVYIVYIILLWNL